MSKLLGLILNFGSVIYHINSIVKILLAPSEAKTTPSRTNAFSDIFDTLP